MPAKSQGLFLFMVRRPGHAAGKSPGLVLFVDGSFVYVRHCVSQAVKFERSAAESLQVQFFDDVVDLPMHAIIAPAPVLETTLRDEDFDAVFTDALLHVMETCRPQRKFTLAMSNLWWVTGV